MRRGWSLTRESFDQLLAWLHPDRDRAGEKYEHVRRALIKIFTSRGCAMAEDLADETINRVTKRVTELMGAYVGDPALYFYGVAHRVYLDAVTLKTPRFDRTLTSSSSGEDLEQQHECLTRCLACLSPENRELIVEYYLHDKQVNIDHRKELAHRLGIRLPTLRLRAHRIRATLEDCLQQCLRQEGDGNILGRTRIDHRGARNVQEAEEEDEDDE